MKNAVSRIRETNVIPGRAEREPGIHNHERGLWIPGPRQEGASRNDGFRAEERAPRNDGVFCYSLY